MLGVPLRGWVASIQCPPEFHSPPLFALIHTLLSNWHEGIQKLTSMLLAVYKGKPEMWRCRTSKKNSGFSRIDVPINPWCPSHQSSPKSGWNIKPRMNLIPFLVVIDPIIRLTDVTNNDRQENSILYNSHAHDYKRTTKKTNLFQEIQWKSINSILHLNHP